MSLEQPKKIKIVQKGLIVDLIDVKIYSTNIVYDYRQDGHIDLHDVRRLKSACEKFLQYQMVKLV